MKDVARARSWFSHGIAVLAGLVAGVIAAPRSDVGDLRRGVTRDIAAPDGVSPVGRSPEGSTLHGAARSNSRSRVSAPGAEAADAEEVAQLTARLRASDAAVARLTLERDEARARAPRGDLTLLGQIYDVSPREGLNAHRDARRALEAARRNRIAIHWAEVVGADVPCIDGSDLHACFSRFYAELTVARSQADTRRLFDAFAPLFRERLEHVRRDDRAVRERVSRGEYPGASAEIRTRIWAEGEAILDALGDLVRPDERTELRLRGCTALGIPEPLERLRLGWGRLVGDDLEPRPHEAPEFESFAWVYATLARERSRDELRELYSTMREAYDPDDASKAYEAIKPQLRSDEWRLLRYHPTDGDIPLSE